MGGNLNGLGLAKPQWPNFVSVLFLIVAIVSLVIYGQVLSTILFLLVAFMGWSRPFEDNRAKGKRTFSDTGRVITGVVTMLLGVLFFGISLAFNHNAPASADLSVTPVTASRGAPCGNGGHVTLVDYAVRTNAPLRTAANEKADQITMALGTDPELKPIALDPMMAVREICRAQGWSEVHVLQLPSDIGKAQGWVPTATLRPVETSENGKRVYNVDDFDWPDDTVRYQKQVLTVVNRIMAQNPKCDAFSNQSILMEKDRAGALFKVACFGEPEQIVDFRLDDATNGRSFAPVAPTDEGTALVYCQAALRERAAHPSTVEIGYGKFSANDDGTAMYRTTFMAKNSFNLTLKYSTLCSFLGDKLVDVEIQETSE